MKNNWCFCDGQGDLDRQTDRRMFLTAAAMGLGALCLGTGKSALAQAAVRSDRQDRNVLVCLFLRGGADGLNIVAPYGEDDYYRARPSLGIKPPSAGVGTATKLIDLDGFFGMSPALASLEKSFKEGGMAFVHAVGSRDLTHSHFEAMNTMERGLADQQDRAGGGWLARHLKMTEGSGSPLRGVALSPFMPDSLAGANQTAAVANLSDYRLEAGKDVQRALTSLHQGTDAFARAGRQTLEILGPLSRYNPTVHRPERGAVYPATPVGVGFQQAAYLIRQDIGIEVCCLDAGNWDTHITQGSTDGWLHGLVKDVSDSIAAFQTDLGSEMSRVTVTVQTEFGRRIEENASLGTDHGAGGLMMVLGAGVNGGKVHGQWPGLAREARSGPGDLAVTTDYRDVMWEVLEKRMGNPDPSRVFPGLAQKSIGVVG